MAPPKAAAAAVSGPVTSRRAPRLDSAQTSVAVASVAFLAIVGAVLAVRILGGDESARVPAPSAVAKSVPTSFGAIAVEDVQELRGLSSRAVGGVTHFPSFVPAEQTQVQVLVSLSNLRGRRVSYSAEQFRLLAGGREITPRASGLTPGTLEPGASVETQLRFLAPRDGSTLRLAFADPGRREPIVIGLGRTSRASARPGGSEGHRH